MRLRYFYCRRHIGFFQQLFRGLEKFIPKLGIEHLYIGHLLFLPHLPHLPTPYSFISPYLIVELFDKLYPQLIKKAQSQLPLVAFL